MDDINHDSSDKELKKFQGRTETRILRDHVWATIYAAALAQDPWTTISAARREAAKAIADKERMLLLQEGV